MMQRILCLGNNSRDTDLRVSDIAHKQNGINHGLIDRAEFEPLLPGFYHSSLVDIPMGGIITLARQFDLVIMLDQPRAEWSHWKLMQTTYKTMVELESHGIAVQFRQNLNVQSLARIESMVSQNPSWCIYPWINILARNHEGFELCARSPTVLSQNIDLESWRTSPKRAHIQQKMLAGERMPEHCGRICYHYENLGIESYRQYESRDWLNQLDIDSFQDLDKINKPYYYEVHWGNLCNLRCRGCVPRRSSAIEQEFRKHGIVDELDTDTTTQFPGIDVVDIPGLERRSRVYVSGGEPVIMPEVLEFMSQCVEQNRTDFELTMSTNGLLIPQRFVDLSRHFSNLNLSFSLDGYDKINDYWRTGADWSRIVANMHKMQQMGHKITVNTVPGIYNVTNLHLLFEWLDREFPHTAIYLQINYNRIQSAYNHPDNQAVIASMKRCQNTRVYWADAKSCRSGIDSILHHYENNPHCDINCLRDFFQFNDKLDRIRGVRLGDHIPELEACRSLIE